MEILARPRIFHFLGLNCQEKKSDAISAMLWLSKNVKALGRSSQWERWWAPCLTARLPVYRGWSEFPQIREGKIWLKRGEYFKHIFFFWVWMRSILHGLVCVWSLGPQLVTVCEGSDRTFRRYCLAGGSLSHFLPLLYFLCVDGNVIIKFSVPTQCLAFSTIIMDSSPLALWAKIILLFLELLLHTDIFSQQQKSN